MIITSWDIGQYVYCNHLFPHCDVINFEINLAFLIKPFFYKAKEVSTKASKQKFKYLENEKIFLRCDQTWFSIGNI